MDLARSTWLSVPTSSRPISAIWLSASSWWRSRLLLAVGRAPRLVDEAAVDPEDHAALEGLAHRLEAALLLKGVVVGKGSAAGVAQLVGDGVEGLAANLSIGEGDGLAVLHEDALDLLEVAVVGAVGGDELSHDGHRLGRVDSEVAARAEEVGVPEAVRIEVAAVLIAHALEAVARPNRPEQRVRRDPKLRLDLVGELEPSEGGAAAQAASGCVQNSSPFWYQYTNASSGKSITVHLCFAKFMES